MVVNKYTRNFPDKNCQYCIDYDMMKCIEGIESDLKKKYSNKLRFKYSGHSMQIEVLREIDIPSAMEKLVNNAKIFIDQNKKPLPTVDVPTQDLATDKRYLDILFSNFNLAHLEIDAWNFPYIICKRIEPGGFYWVYNGDKAYHDFMKYMLNNDNSKSLTCFNNSKLAILKYIIEIWEKDSWRDKVEILPQ